MAGRFVFSYDVAMNNDCIFCKIAHAEERQLIWENDRSAAFYDLHPKAPVHVLIVSRKHYANLLEACTDQEMMAGFLTDALEVARRLGVEEAFRYHINNGEAAGQEVQHLHAHLLAAKPGETWDMEAVDQAHL